MGVIETGIGRIRWAALVPRLDIVVEGTAHICTSEHGPWSWWEGKPKPPPGPRHIDVSLNMLTRGRRPIAVVSATKARAAGQDLQASGFPQLTLVPGEPLTSCQFTLWPLDKVEPRAGDWVKFRLRLGAVSLKRRVKLRIAAAG